jgi:hypothetical protein
VPLLQLTDEEAKVLAFIVHLGATAFDVPGDIQRRHVALFKVKFGIDLSTEHILNLLNKTQELTDVDRRSDA